MGPNVRLKQNDTLCVMSQIGPVAACPVLVDRAGIADTGIRQTGLTTSDHIAGF